MSSSMFVMFVREGDGYKGKGICWEIYELINLFFIYFLCDLLQVL